MTMKADDVEAGTKRGLDQLMWALIRDYITAEVRLALARDRSALAEVSALEARSTGLETAIREMLPERVSVPRFVK